MTKKFVLIIDDDATDEMSYYVRALERSGDLRPVLVRSVDTATQHLIRADPIPDVVVLDTMMPPGERFRDRPDAAGGMLTGVLFYKEVLSLLRPTPKVVFLTNSTTGKDEAQRLFPGVPAYEKVDTRPTELVKICRTLLENPGKGLLNPTP